MTTVGRFICPHCSAEFDTQDLLQSHEQQAHLLGAPTVDGCPHCGIEFTTEAKLPEHVQREHGRTESR